MLKCKGSGCFKRWKKVAKMYEGFGDPAKAIKVYRRLVGMTHDPTSKERFRKRIIALGGTPD
ncbi:MAG: tetratricopeptide repeat-containing protein [Deltaproteobacteria bacterium]|nr:tetratricopeptide repeat-containing protein [Deltaproteobacteria bacterium]